MDVQNSQLQHNNVGKNGKNRNLSVQLSLLKARQFERYCMRKCLKMYKTPESGHKKYYTYKKSYDKAYYIICIPYDIEDRGFHFKTNERLHR